MKALHRTLNVVFSVLTIFFVVAVVFRVLPGRVEAPSIPVVFSIYAIVLPTALQIWTTIASWSHDQDRLKTVGVILGLVAAAITSYVAIFLAIASSRMESHGGYFSPAWIAGCQALVVLFVLTCLANIVFFSRVLLRDERKTRQTSVP